MAKHGSNITVADLSKDKAFPSPVMYQGVGSNWTSETTDDTLVDVGTTTTGLVGAEAVRKSAKDLMQII